MSPGRMRIKCLRILPAMWAMISWPLSSLTRNCVLARACITLPWAWNASSLAIKRPWREISFVDRRIYYFMTRFRFDHHFHFKGPKKRGQDLSILDPVPAFLGPLFLGQRPPLVGNQRQQRLLRFGELLDAFGHQGVFHFLHFHQALDFRED